MFLFLIHGDIKYQDQRIAVPGFLFVNVIYIAWQRKVTSNLHYYKHTTVFINTMLLICLSETYLDNSVLSEESDLDIPGYKMVKDYYPGNGKRGRVCIYFKESLSTRLLDVFSLLR